MENKNIKELSEKHIKGDCTEQEIALLENWYLNWVPEKIIVDADEFEQAKAEVYAKLPVKEMPVKAHMFSWSRIAVAATFFLVVGAGLLYYNKASRFDGIQELELAARQIKAGSNKAYLILGDGKKISLTDAPEGSLAKEAGIEISKTGDGQIVYTVQNDDQINKHHSEGVLNRIETPKGGQYQVHLPDGTKVWLNAASSIRYAVNFTSSKQRSVELTGEAYFEVSKDKKHPFLVKCPGQEIVVLGTHFNINSYKDEPNVTTTLLEGSVKVNVSAHPEGSLILKPGQQSILTPEDIKVKPADEETDLAWKNGLFVFKDERLDNIMRQMERWYDVEVVFEGDIASRHFEGTISRSQNVSEILRKFQLTNNVHFKIEGRRITVMP